MIGGYTRDARHAHRFCARDVSASRERGRFGERELAIPGFDDDAHARHAGHLVANGSHVAVYQPAFLVLRTLVRAASRKCGINEEQV